MMGKKRSRNVVQPLGDNIDSKMNLENEKAVTKEDSLPQASDPTKILNVVFSEGRSIKHKIMAVAVLADRVTSCSSENLCKYSSGWIGQIMKMLEMTTLCDADKTLCCFALCKLLVLCGAHAELRRDLSSNAIPKLLTLLLSITTRGKQEDELITSSVFCMKMCIKNFAGCCLSFKNKIEAYLLKILLSPSFLSEELSQVCFSCFALLPACGGAGSSGSKHTDMWNDQIRRLCLSSAKLINFIFTPCGEEYTSAVIPYESSLPELPVINKTSTPDTLTCAATHLKVYLKCMQIMLKSKFSAPVQVPVKHLLSLICKITSVTPDSVIFKHGGSELQAVKYSLSNLHEVSMNFLSALINVRVRSATYDVITTLMTSPGMHTLLEGATDKLLMHIQFDISKKPIHTENAQDAAFAAEPKSKKAKRQLVNSGAAEITGSPGDFSLRSRWQISTENSLHALEGILSLLSHSASNSMLKAIYNSLLVETLHMQNETTPECSLYTVGLRYRLYSCLLSTVLAFGAQSGPLTHTVVKLFAAGVQDSCLKVKAICASALRICQLSLHPRAPPLQSYPSCPDNSHSTNEELIKRLPTAAAARKIDAVAPPSVSIIAEPVAMNTDSEERDDDEAIQEVNSRESSELCETTSSSEEGEEQNETSGGTPDVRPDQPETVEDVNALSTDCTVVDDDDPAVTNDPAVADVVVGDVENMLCAFVDDAPDSD